MDSSYFMSIFTTQSNKLVMEESYKQKILLTRDMEKVNVYLDGGWEIVSVTAQHVASGGNNDYHIAKDLEGAFAIVIQKRITPKLKDLDLKRDPDSL